ncbi:MAG: glycine oxidase ThiO [Brevibacterium sp.]|uniref:glycine oxidase ThiO n=1 Tax=Brevibacterium sandarakinum TaxID=629680 RepID=UPI002654D03E|nr:glycine oxidase ThiO [Brevibacterium sandarakinum]MDN5586301.1 glycine oxidase ThiO [Brevibacterium sp.]MDN5634058.1 glycine oxidase ThiO [Brevibacterium sp.]MDN5656886.1 glycine oxidase ThiO [Brevibacterium sandarakinum]
MHAIVIGAGIIGLSTAWNLHRRGVGVTIVDPAPATGASHAAAGMLAPAAEVVWGQSPLYPLMRSSADLYPDFAADLAAESGHDLGYSGTETFVCAGDRADLASLRELTELQRSAGFDVSLIPGSRARELEPSLAPGVCGAVTIPGDHSIDPRRVTGALLAILGDAVVRARVSGLLSEAGRTVGVELEDGTRLKTDQVVVAAGGSCNDIAGMPTLPLRQVWGEVIRLRAPKSLAPLLTRTIRGLINGRPVYVVPRPDGELVLGATSREDGRSGTNAGGVHQLLRDAERLVPAILEAEITDITTRARPGSPDDVPIIGRIDPGCVVSTGFFRHGILLAPLGAGITADLVCRSHTRWAPSGTLAAAPARFDQSPHAHHLQPTTTDPNQQPAGSHP